MQRSFVTSSRIISVGWEGGILEVEFRDGAVYHYYDVSHDEYTSFMGSSSLGSALSRLDKAHKYRRIS